MDNYYKVLRFEHIDILLKHIKPLNIDAWRKVLLQDYNSMRDIFVEYGYLVIRDDYDKEHFLFWNSKTNFSDIAEEELILFNPGFNTGFNTDIIDKIENILNEIENGKE